MNAHPSAEQHRRNQLLALLEQQGTLELDKTSLEHAGYAHDLSCMEAEGIVECTESSLLHATYRFKAA